MKIFKFLVTILFFAICFQSCNQKPKIISKISALKLKKEMAKKFHEGTKIQGFNVDKDGVLRPDKDYEIVILNETKQFLVKPKGMEYNMADKFDTEEMPDGSTMICNCGFGAGDNCAIGETQLGPSSYYKCTGTCNCGAFYLDAEFKVAQYETMDGNWNSF